MQSDCLFCRIIRGEIPSQKVYEDEYVYAFRDINPIAPVHVLIVPKEHMTDALCLTGETSAVAAHVFAAAAAIARQEGLADKGFRVVTNCGEDAGQTVPHLHFHLLGGKPMSWTVD